jgi:hypothetical protein
MNTLLRALKIDDWITADAMNLDPTVIKRHFTPDTLTQCAIFWAEREIVPKYLHATI